MLLGVALLVEIAIMISGAVTSNTSLLKQLELLDLPALLMLSMQLSCSKRMTKTQVLNNKTTCAYALEIRLIKAATL